MTTSIRTLYPPPTTRQCMLIAKTVQLQGTRSRNNQLFVSICSKEIQGLCVLLPLYCNVCGIFTQYTLSECYRKILTLHLSSTQNPNVTRLCYKEQCKSPPHIAFLGISRLFCKWKSNVVRKYQKIQLNNS